MDIEEIIKSKLEDSKNNYHKWITHETGVEYEWCGRLRYEWLIDSFAELWYWLDMMEAVNNPRYVIIQSGSPFKAYRLINEDI